MIAFTTVLLLALLINGYHTADPSDSDYEDEDYNPSPCNIWRPGDPDLTTFDLISTYHLDEYRYEFQGVRQVAGSSAFQTAYHLEEYTNMTIESIQAFPNGVPHEFSFECTFRTENPPVEPWYLFQITDYTYESLLSVTINPVYNSIDLSLPQFDGTIQTVSFQETEIFDRSWHKVMFGVTQDAVRLWVDCKPAFDRNGSDRVPLDVRGSIDASDGYFSVAQDVRSKQTVPIDLQWMIVSCDAEKPTRTSCEEIPMYEVSPDGSGGHREYGPTPPTSPSPPSRSTPRIPTTYDRSTPRIPTTYAPTRTTTSTGYPTRPPWEQVCPEQCPRGPPGPIGPPGLPGRDGFPGPQGPPGMSTGRYGGNVEKGQKGEQGIQGLPGIAGIGLQGQKGEPGLPGFARGERGYPGEIGRPGPPGPPGVPSRLGSGIQLDMYGSPGLPGPPGQKGEIGAEGSAGVAGLQGLQGLQGEPGYPGLPGIKGDAGEAGPPGKDGLPGVAGYPGSVGAPGPVGPSGPPGPPGPAGVSGSMKTDTYRYEENEIRDICMSVVREYITEISSTLVGPPGPPGKGRIGRPGPPGPQGPQGEQGHHGPTGDRGYPGLPGAPGPQGIHGHPGQDGQKGDRGSDGIGREGPPGQPGPQGLEGRGIDGLNGRPGDRGEPGRPGETGPRGPPGQPGVCPDCSYQNAYAAYPLLLHQQQQNNKGPQNQYNKG